MVKFLLLLFSGLLAILVSGCSILKPTELPVVTRYSLVQASTVHLNVHPSKTTLMVADITANPAYQTAKMVYIVKPHQINYFSKNKWIGPPAEMLQPLLVQSLQNSGYFHAVVAAPFSGKTNYRLDAHIITLDQLFLTRPSEIKFTLQVEVVSQKTNQVIASQTFTQTVKAPGNNPQSGVDAANQAVQKVLTQVARFTVHSLTGQAAHAQKHKPTVLDEPFS